MADNITGLNTVTANADTDANGVGEVKLRTRNLDRVVVRNFGLADFLVGFTAPGFVNVRAHGAKGDGVANDAAAFNAALAALAAQGGGILFIPKGDFLITTAVSGNLTGASIVIQGCGGSSRIKVKTGAATICFQLANAESVTLRDFAFVSGDLATANDALTTLSFSACLKAVVDRVDFYGLACVVAGGAIVAAVNTNLWLRDCNFSGCCVASGVGASVVSAVSWKGLYVEGCDFVDYGTLNGVYYSKTPLASPLAWIGIGDPASVIWNAREQHGLEVRHCRFDEGAVRCISASASRGATGKYINALKVENCAFNIGNIGNTGILAINVNRLTVEDCAFGWASVTQGNMLYLQDVRSALLRGCDYDTPQSGQIYLDTPTYYGTMLTIEQSRFLQIVSVPSGSHVLRFLNDAFAHWVKDLPSGTFSYASLTPAEYFQTVTDIKVGGRVKAGSLGVGNTAAATTPGAVVRKMEVFDNAGASLGFVPIYNSIS